MAIRIILKDGTAVEGSVKELAEFYQYVGWHGQTQKTDEDRRTSIASSGPSLERLPATAIELLQLLMSSNEPIDTADVSKTLGVKPRGIGGYVLALTNWGKRNGYPSRSQLITKSRRKSEGKSIRTITLSKNFRQSLREGKFAGMPRNN